MFFLRKDYPFSVFFSFLLLASFSSTLVIALFIYPQVCLTEETLVINLVGNGLACGYVNKAVLQFNLTFLQFWGKMTHSLFRRPLNTEMMNQHE